MFVPVTLLFVHKVYIGEPWGLLLPMAVASVGKGCGIRGFNDQRMDQALCQAPRPFLAYYWLGLMTYCPARRLPPLTRCLGLGGPFLASWLGRLARCLGLGC